MRSTSSSGGGPSLSNRRFLLTCAMTQYLHCSDWDRPELQEDVDRIVRLFCGDFMPSEGRYEHSTELGTSPSSVELLDRLRRFCINKQRRSDDYVAIYIAGHGEVPDDGQHVILTSDTDPLDLLHRTVPTAELVRLAIAGTSVQRLLLMLDTCYSGRGGVDIARESLLRLETPSLIDHHRATSGRGIVVISSTRPFQQAIPGTFTTFLERSAYSLATAGFACPTLRIGALIGQINADPEKPETQSSEWHQLGLDDDEPAFLINPRYRAPLVDADLLVQERARHAEQRHGQLTERFLPATRWFTGRHSALASLANWLSSKAPPNACVVTGNAGSGKTALLGLIAAISDPDQRPGVPMQDLPNGLLIAENIIDEVIYAGNMRTEEIRDRLANAAGLHVTSTQQLIDGLNRKRHGDALVAIVDAIDEAADPNGLAANLLATLLLSCGRSIKLIIGTRPHILTPKLLGRHDAGNYAIINLDSQKYADPNGIQNYIRRILLSIDSLDNEYTPSGIYQKASEETLEFAVRAICAAAGDSFLVARIAATTEATARQLPARDDPEWKYSLPRRAGEAMARDLRLRLGDNASKAAQLLIPLAYAQGNGLPWEDVWPRLTNALSQEHKYSNSDLVWLRTAAGSYAVEGTFNGRSVYRLYHQALTDYLLQERDQKQDQRLITETLCRQASLMVDGRRDWTSAHPYVLKYLAIHAARGGCIDALATDAGFLLAADIPELLSALDETQSVSASVAAEAFRRAVRELRNQPVKERASYLQLAARCSGADELSSELDAYRQRGTWSARWASWRYQPPQHALTNPPRYRHLQNVLAMAVTFLDGRQVVVAGYEHEPVVCIWDLSTGRPVGDPFKAHKRSVRALALKTVGGQSIVASGDDDGTLRIWDLATRAELGGPCKHPSPDKVAALAIAELDGRAVAVSGTYWPYHLPPTSTPKIWIWDLKTKTLDRTFADQQDRVTALIVTELNSRQVIVYIEDSRRIRVRDLTTGTPLKQTFQGHTDIIYAISIAHLEDRPVLISASQDQSLRVWDLATGNSVGGPLLGHNGGVSTVAVTELRGRTVIISGSVDTTARVWDLATGVEVTEPFTSHYPYYVSKLAVGEIDDRPVVVSAPSDAFPLRVWDLAARIRPLTVLSTTSHEATVEAIATSKMDGREVAVSSSRDSTLRVWNAATGSPVGPVIKDIRVLWHVNGVATIKLDGRPVAVTAGDAVRVWDLATGIENRHLSFKAEGVETHLGSALAITRTQGLTIAAFAADTSVYIWDLNNGKELGRFFPFSKSAFSPLIAVAELNGTTVAFCAATGDKEVTAWKVPQGGPILRRFRHSRLRHSSGVTALAAYRLNDRSLLAVGSYDGTVTVWDLARRSELSRKRAPDHDMVRSITFLSGDHIAFSVGNSLNFTYIIRQNDVVETIRLEAEVNAVGATSESALVVATDLGLVKFDIPR